MIIALGGKKQSGKSTISGWLEEIGFKRLSFADQLKNAVSLFLKKGEGCPLNKDEIINVSFSREECEELGKILKLSTEEISKFSCGKKASSIRELLQIVGSDIIRNIDENWHISHLSNLIKDGDYVVDDVRFPNEKAFLEKEGAICMYVIRQDNFSIDAHGSEFSLNWWDFDDWIINNPNNTIRNKKNIHSLVFNIKNDSFGYKLGKLIGNPIQKREIIKSKIRELGIKDASVFFDVHETVLSKKARSLCIFFDKEYHRKINRFAFSEISVESSYLAGVICADGCLTERRLALSLTDEEIINKLTAYLNDPLPHFIQKKSLKNERLKDAHVIRCGDIFLIENLKLWGLKPRKSQRESFPPILINNGIEDLRGFKAWIVGMIDGDGCVVYDKKRNRLRINLLCSKEIALKIKEIVPKDISICINKVKTIELVCLSINGKFAMQFFNWLGRPDYGLRRKWDKIKMNEEYRSIR